MNRMLNEDKKILDQSSFKIYEAHRQAAEAHRQVNQSQSLKVSDINKYLKVISSNHVCDLCLRLQSRVKPTCKTC